MGRKAKYFNELTAQPFVDAILADLGLTGKIQVLTIKFGTYTTMNGDIEYYDIPHNDGKYVWCTIRANRKQELRATLETLMHELKHLQQYYTGALAHTGKKNYKRWNGIEMQDIPWQDSFTKYMNLPWEKEAFEYETKIDRLFPGLQVQTKKLIGVVGGVTFYKTGA